VTFADPLWLLGLLLVPALALAARRRARPPGPAYPVASDAAGLAPTWAVRLRGLPVALRLAALALALVAMARPQRPDVSAAREAEGIDIVLVLDASSSMEAPDFFPTRYEAAKEVAAEFVRGRKDDRIGLVVFAGEAFTAAPLTLDHDFVLRMLRPSRAEVTAGAMEGGTAIGTAVATAAARLRGGDDRGRVVVLLTDGENNAGAIDPLTAAEAAAALGVRVYAIGVGATSAFPSLGGARDGLDEATLQAVARTTGARYFRATDADALRAIYDEISRLETTRVETPVDRPVDERYGLFLWPALGLLALDVLLATTRLRRVP
jgi:Ca-activated chloride channel family protein